MPRTKELLTNILQDYSRFFVRDFRLHIHAAASLYNCMCGDILSSTSTNSLPVSLLTSSVLTELGLHHVLN